MDFILHFNNRLGEVCAVWFKCPNGLHVSLYFIIDSYLTIYNAEGLDLGPVYDRSPTRLQPFTYLPTYLTTYLPAYKYQCQALFNFAFP
jgi:hypothetical protein